MELAERKLIRYLLAKMVQKLNHSLEDPSLQKFIEGIKEFKKQIKAIYLFGSRARQTFRPNSDYDLLIVARDKGIKDKLYDLAVDIFCETGADISLKIFSTDDFNRMKSLSTPFIKNVLGEGRQIA